MKQEISKIMSRKSQSKKNRKSALLCWFPKNHNRKRNNHYIFNDLLYYLFRCCFTQTCNHIMVIQILKVWNFSEILVYFELCFIFTHRKRRNAATKSKLKSKWFPLQAPWAKFHGQVHLQVHEKKIHHSLETEQLVCK